jgi:hypothetical protein
MKNVKREKAGKSRKEKRGAYSKSAGISEKIVTVSSALRSLR